MYPLKFNTIFKTKVWGGEKIAPFKGIRTDQRNIGESWELSGLKEDESIVLEGPFAGKTITELAQAYRGQLLGEKVYERTGTEFPLLIKFIDAREDLSIQVHPDDALAEERHNGSKGKTEMWYVVQADQNAHLMCGLTRKITPEEYAAKVENNTITDVLHDYNVKAGDVFFLPAGRIHSIGAGCFITEIQQTSDITYRIYDFGRVGLDGRYRELHTELSKEAIDYTVLVDYKTAYKNVKNVENQLVDCRYFTTSLLDLTEPVNIPVKERDSFMVVICVEGCGVLTDSEDNMITLSQGETILIPACTEKVTFSPTDSMKLLTSYIR